jgi:endonuclease G
MNELTMGAVNIFTSMPFAKIVYSFAILVAISVGVSELYRLWFDRTLEVQVFKFLESSAPRAEGGTAFTWGVIERHAALRERFRQAEAEAIDAEQIYRTKDDSPIRGTETVLSDLNITVSEFNVTAFLNYLRRWVSAPQELRGMVTKNGDNYDISGEIRGGPAALADGQLFNRTLHYSNIGGAEAAVFQTACHLIWVSAAQQQKELARIGSDEFCLWTKYWSDLLDIRDETVRNGQLSKSNADRLDELLSNVSLQVDRPARYIRFRDLRGDMFGVRALWGTDPKKKHADRLAAQRDHFDYLKSLNADLRGTVDLVRLAGNPNLYRILAATRPAIPVNSDFSLDYSAIEATDKLQASGSYAHFWQSAFSDADNVTSAAKAMGLARIFRSSGEPVSTVATPGFAIGEKLVATAGIAFDPTVFDIRVPAPYWFDIPPGFKMRFSFVRSTGDAGDHNSGIEVKRLLVLGGGAADLVLLELAEHDTINHPPIPLDASGTEADAAGEFIAVLGYPVKDQRMPADFSNALLGDKEGILRVMPGRSTADVPSGGSLGQLRLTFEASTTPGTAGGPVIGLHSGKLVGISMAGGYLEAEMLKVGSALRTSDIVSREPFKSALEARGVALELSMGSLISAIPQAQAGVPVAAAGPAVEAQFEDRQGYDSGFLQIDVPLPRRLTGPVLTPLTYTHFSILFDKDRRMPAVAIANVDGGALESVRRDPTQRYYLDKRISPNEQLGSDYFYGNDFDRGTLLRRGYVTWGDTASAMEAARDLYAMTGVTPQRSLFNQKSWSDLERFIFDWITRNKARATVMAGPVFSSDDPVFNGVAIPRKFWQILVARGRNGSLQAAGFLLSQDLTSPSSDSIDTNIPTFDPKLHRVEVREIEKLTGLDLGDLVAANPIE